MYKNIFVLYIMISAFSYIYAAEATSTVGAAAHLATIIAAEDIHVSTCAAPTSGTSAVAARAESPARGGAGIVSKERRASLMAAVEEHRTHYLRYETECQEFVTSHALFHADPDNKAAKDRYHHSLLTLRHASSKWFNAAQALSTKGESVPLDKARSIYEGICSLDKPTVQATIATIIEDYKARIPANK